MVYKVGIIGFGKLGQYIYAKLRADTDFEIVFVWNRTHTDELKRTVPEELILHGLHNAQNYSLDLIVEVAHPQITIDHGPKLINTAPYFVGSLTALADNELAAKMCACHNALYVPTGALWGSFDIQRMARRKTLTALTVSMSKHPSCFRFANTEMQSKADRSLTDGKEVCLYEGPVRDLCIAAPNNVNTMAAACLIAPNMGFDGVTGRLVADPSLSDRHVVTVHVEGENGFNVTTTRSNPSGAGSVTGQETFGSFYSSIVAAVTNINTPGLHLC